MAWHFSFFALICYFCHWTLFVWFESSSSCRNFGNDDIFSKYLYGWFQCGKIGDKHCTFHCKSYPIFFCGRFTDYLRFLKKFANQVELNLSESNNNTRTHTPPARKKNTLSKKNKIIDISLACLCYAMVELVWFVVDICLIFVLCAFWDVFVCLHIVCFLLDSVNSIFVSLKSNYQSKKKRLFSFSPRHCVPL